MTNGEGNGQTWKWIAGLLSAVVITGLPGYVAMFRTAERVDDVASIQQEMLERLATVEANQQAAIELLQEARAKLDLIQQQGGK